MMKKLHTIASMTTLALLSSASLYAQSSKELPDTFLLPEKAVVISGDKTAGRPLVAILYDQSDLHYSDPRAPRFLFLDKKGKVALGIGGYVKGTLQYDMDGAIDNGASFSIYDIPVPLNPALRNQYYANANHSTIFLQLVGKSEKFGYYQAYIQTNFSGNGPDGYGLKLKQAYLSLGYVTAGLTRSTFVDGAAGTPTIDDQGPAGEMSATNIILQYKPQFNRNWSGAISVEMPEANYSTNADVESIKQRVPDIPVHVQYAWGNNSHVRVSALMRNLSYRNLLASENKFVFGWAAQLSGVVNFDRGLSLYYQGAYGKGYARYVNDLSDRGYDLIPCGTTGEMKAPEMMNFEVGLKKAFASNFFMAASYSQARVYGQQVLGGDAYRYGQYVSVSGFYDIVSDLRVGLEYLYGNRANLDGSHGHANRIEGLLQFSF